MSTPDALLKRAHTLLDKVKQQQQPDQAIEFETCWGGEVPPEWEGQHIIVIEWSGGALDEDGEV